MSSWHSYPSLYTLGHRLIANLFDEPIGVEEKVDGSQFSFGRFVGADGSEEIRIRSKGATMLIDAPERMFSAAAETVKEIAPLLMPNWTYRGEYLQKPKHNALAYDRIPNKHIILFDVCTAEETYLNHRAKSLEAHRIGLECVPLIATVQGDCLDRLRSIIDNTVSVLGGQKIEGVVCKQIDVTRFGPDKKALIGKFVSEAFKEVHAKEWKNSNPTAGDVLQLLGAEYGTATRWHKAIQHLREAGQITDTPKDIGPIMKEIPGDIRKECEDEIKAKLFAWAWPHISRMTTRGFPEFYKEQLLKLQFDR